MYNEQTHNLIPTSKNLQIKSYSKNPSRLRIKQNKKKLKNAYKKILLK